MHTSSRHTLSAATALGLVSFTITSAFASGVAATPTLIAFGLLALYGVLEIAILSYASPRPITSPVRPRPVVRVAPRIRVPALVEYPSVRHARLIQAA